MDRFALLLDELGELLETPLQPDGHRLCSLLFDEKISIQIELDDDDEYILIGSLIGELPPGKFREEILKAALFYNGKPPYTPPLGFSDASSLEKEAQEPRASLAYLERKNSLMLFIKCPLEQMNGQKLSLLFPPLLYEIKIWREALETGHMPSPDKGALSSPL